MEAYGQIPWLWGAALVFGNLFALLWAAVAVCNTYPEYWCKLKSFWKTCGGQLSPATANSHHSLSTSTTSSSKGVWGLTGQSHPSLADTTRRPSLKSPQDACQGAQQPSQQQQQKPAVHIDLISSACTIQAAAITSSANGHVLPAKSREQRAQLAWRGVGLIARSKTVLQGVYGSAEPGQVHAVIGPSGCGKTVLLELLAMRLGSSTKQQAAPASKGPHSNMPVAKTDSNGAAASCVLGQVLVNGRPLSRQQLQAVSAFMPETETDGLVPVMTAFEMVSFCTALRLPHLNREEQRVRTETVLDMLGLSEQHDTLVGGLLPGGTAVRGLSGGERKRCSIACAVVSLPHILLLDGPLSGLDSFAALSVVRYLKSIAETQHAAVVFTLHQPRAAIWAQMNKVTLLASGHMMYSGATDDLVPWFESLGFSYEPTVHGLVPDWALDLVSQGFSNSPAANPVSNGHSNGHSAGHSASNGHGRATAFVSQRRQHQLQLDRAGSDKDTARFGGKCTIDPLAAAAEAFLWHLKDQQRGSLECSPGKLSETAGGAYTVGLGGLLHGGGSSSNSSTDAASDSLSSLDVRMPAVQGGGSKCGWLSRAGVGAAFKRYRALLWREAVFMTRNPLNVAGRMMIFTYVGLIFGLVYYNMGGGASTIPVRMSVVHVDIVFLVLVTSISMPLFYEDTKYFVHDTKAGLYRPLEYLLARMTVAIPFTIIMGAVLHFILFGMAGMRHGAVYMLQSCALAVLCLLIAMQVIQICAMAASSQDLAFAIVCAWIAVNIFVHPFHHLYSNYTLGWGLSWLRYLSAVSWAWQGVVTVELKDRYFDCSHGSGVSALGIFPELLPTSSVLLRQIKQQIDNLGDGCIASGNAVVSMYTQELPYGATFSMLLGYYSVTLVITYLIAVRKAKKAAS